MKNSEISHSNGSAQIPSRDSTFLDYWPTMTSACWLFLISFGLVVIVGGVLQDLTPGWGLILTEVLLILLPTLISLWIRKYPIRQTLRLRWPPFPLSILSLLIGIALRPIAILLANMVYEILHISLSGMTDNEYTPFQTILQLIGLVILAPICEEVLFRGYIQRAFSRRGAWSGIIITGLLFIMFHQSLISIPALLPLAFITGYIAWRSNSLIPAIILHIGYNGSLPLALVVDPALGSAITSVKITIPSLVVTLVALWLIWRITKPGQITESLVALSPRWVFIVITIAIVALFSLTSVAEILVLTGKLP